MNRLFPTILFSTFLLASSTIFAQAPASYSESKPYSPILVETSKVLYNKNSKEAAELKTSVPDPVAESIANTTVTIPVSALTRSGELVPGLQPSEFKVFVDTSEAEIVSVQTKSDAMTIVLAIDVSPSSQKYLDLIKSLTSRLLSKLRPDDKVTLITFDRDTKVLIEPTSDRASIAKAMTRLRTGEGTAIYQTVRDLYEKKLALIQAPIAILLMTDGIDTMSRNTTYQMSLHAAEMGNAPVYPIYFDTYDPAADPKVITGLATAPPIPVGYPALSTGLTKDDSVFGKIYLTELLKVSGGRPVMAEDLRAGKMDGFDSIPSELIARYFITFKIPEPRKLGERRTVKIRINRPDLKILAKGSYIEK